MIRERPTGGEIIVLTGSSGCLGHSTLRLLISHDKTVGEIRCLDLVEPEESMKKSIDQDQEQLQRRFGYRKQIKFVKGDIRDISTVERIVDGADCIIHCAAKIDVWVENNDQDEDLLRSINVGGTKNLLEAAVRFGVGRFVHVSSFESFVGMYEGYNVIEDGIILTDDLLFGASGTTKREADRLVVEYSNSKLSKDVRTSRGGSLRVVIIKTAFIYGEYEKYFVSQLLKVTKFFNGTLQRYTNHWIKHRPIYVGNAAWSLIKAKRQLDVNEDISGEEFFISDDTPISDSFDFLEPFLEAKGMKVTKSTRPGLIAFLVLLLFFKLKRLASKLNPFGLFQRELSESSEPTKWYQVVTPQIFLFMINSLYLYPRKAIIRLQYEPLFDWKESLERSLNWYSQLEI